MKKSNLLRATCILLATALAFAKAHATGSVKSVSGYYPSRKTDTNTIAHQIYHDGTPGDRMAAKTSVANGPVISFPDVLALKNSLSTDSHMRSLGISESPSSGRVQEERTNVVVEAWVYAVEEEDDNDFHLILGTDPSKATRSYMTAEVSGVPASGPDVTTLLKARGEALALLSGNIHRGSYKKLQSPLPVQVSGSLFFDVDHGAGVVGPTGMKPSTAWEIHPVTQIIPQH